MLSRKPAGKWASRGGRFSRPGSFGRVVDEARNTRPPLSQGGEEDGIDRRGSTPAGAGAAPPRGGRSPAAGDARRARRPLTARQAIALERRRAALQTVARTPRRAR